MSSDYRDPEKAATEHLTRLEDESDRVDATRRERRRNELEARRAEVRRVPSSEKRPMAIFWLAALLGAFALRSGIKVHGSFDPSPTSYLVVLVAIAAALGAGVIALVRQSLRHRSLAAIDEELKRTIEPRVRVAPADLSAMHARIAEIETELSEAESETAQPRPARATRSP